MDRFFSKLDLRDIRIDPYNTSFPPDDDGTAATGQAPESAPEPAPVERERVSHVPAWAAASQAEEPSAPVFNGAAADEVMDGLERSGDVLKVSARSRPSAVAGAIAGVVRERGRAEVQAIGAGATNQAVKAVAIAREYLRETGIEAVCLPSFIDITIENEDRTAILMVVEPR